MLADGVTFAFHGLHKVKHGENYKWFEGRIFSKEEWSPEDYYLDFNSIESYGAAIDMSESTAERW